MSGAQTPTSSEAQRNVLFNPLAVPQAQELQNKLAGQQLDLSNANMEQVSRVAAALLNEPDPAKRAELYPRYVGSLQSQGYAMHAPAMMPDEPTLQMLARQGTPSQTQAEWAQNLAANKAYLNANNPPATPGTGAGATPAAGQGPSFAGGIAGFESGGVSNPPENPRWPVAQGGPAGPHQFIASTWNQFAQANPDLFKGMTPDQILAARTDTTPVGPNGEDRSTLATNWYAGENAKVLQASNIAPTPANLGIAHALGAGGATKVLSAPDNTPLSQVIPETIPQNPQYGRMTVGDLKQRYARLGPVGGGTATVSAGGGAAPGRTQVASTVPVALPAATTEPQPPTVTASGSTAQPAATPLPPDQAVTQAKATGQPVPVAGSQGLWALPSGNLTSTPPPATTTAQPPASTAQPGQPGVRQPPQPPQPPPAAPLPPPPQMPVLNANGLTDLQQRQVNAIAANPQNKQPAVAAAQQAFVNQNIQLRQQAFSDYMQQQQLAVAQGTLSNAQAELNLKTWQAAHPTPTTPRFTQNTEAVWNPSTKTFEPVTPDNTNTGPHVVGSWGVNNVGGMQFLPAASTPATGTYENVKAAYNADIPTIKAIAESGRSSQASALQLNELADVIKGVQSGGILPEFRAKVAALMEANGAKPETIQAMTGMSSGSDAQVLQKLAVATIGASAKSDLGSNVGVESLNLYAGANPGMDKLEDANKRVTNMIRVAREQIGSYSLGAQQHFNENQTSMLHTPQGQVPDYHPLSEYNEKWQAKNNPQIGAAAIGILNGDGFDKWAARASPEEALNAVRLAARIDPNIQIPVKSGGFKTAQEVLSHGAGQ